MCVLKKKKKKRRMGIKIFLLVYLFLIRYCKQKALVYYGIVKSKLIYLLLMFFKLSNAIIIAIIIYFNSFGAHVEQIV